MGISIPTAILIAAAVTATGTVMQMQSQKKAASQRMSAYNRSQDAQRRAEAAQKRAADLQALRRRQNLVREARIKRAQVVQAGVSAGVGGESTAIVGGAYSVTTDLSSTISFLDQTRASNELARVEFGRARAIASRPITLNTTGSAIAAFGGMGLALATSKSGAKIFNG